MTVPRKTRPPVGPTRGDEEAPRAPLSMELNVERFVEQCQALAARLPGLSGDGRYDALIGLLRQTPCDRTREGRAVVAALVAELADRAVEEVGRTARASGQGVAAFVAGIGAGNEPHVTRALAVMAECAADPALCLDRVAWRVGLSRWQLSRLLRRWTGQSFFGLLSALRVHEAKRLLVETELSIKEVAARCGYDHVSQLDHQFRRAAGVTPGVYRALWKAG